MMKSKSKVIASLVIMCFFLSGCTASQFSAIGIFAIGYTIWTDKLPTDRILESITDKDCSTVRAELEGGPVCVEKVENEAQGSDVPIWCYRNIAGIDCYYQEIPQYSDRLVK